MQDAIQIAMWVWVLGRLGWFVFVTLLAGTNWPHQLVGMFAAWILAAVGVTLYQFGFIRLPLVFICSAVGGVFFVARLALPIPLTWLEEIQTDKWDIILLFAAIVLTVMRLKTRQQKLGS